MQRLFSTFAGGWPGLGLLILRLVVARAVIAAGIWSLSQPSSATPLAPQLIGTAASLLLLIGLWTPVAAALVAFAELWTSLSTNGDSWDSLLLGAVAVSLALLGPGAWSLDARLFGRKLVVLDEDQRRSLIPRK